MGDPYVCGQYWFKRFLWPILVTFTLLLQYLIIKYNLPVVLIMYVPIARPGQVISTTWSSVEPWARQLLRPIASVTLLCDHFYVLLKWYHRMVCFPSTSSWPLTHKWAWFLFLISKKERVKSQMSLADIIIAFWAEPKCFSRRTISD